MNTNTEIEKFEHKADVVGTMIQAVLAIFLTLVKKLLTKVRDVSANDLQVHQELAGGVPRVSLRGGAQPLVVCDFPGLAVSTERGALDDGRTGSEGPPASPPSDAPAQGPPSEGPPAKPPSETPPCVPSEGPPASPSEAPAEAADVTHPTTWAWFELSREAWESLGERGQELLEELLGRELVTWDEVGDVVGSKPISPTSRVVMRAALARVPGLTWKEHELVPSAKAEDRLLVIDRAVVASLPDALRTPFETEERWRTAYLVSDHDQPHLLLDGGDCDDAEDATEAFEEARAHIAAAEAAGYRLDATETTHMLACTQCGEGEHARGLRPGGICGECVRNARFSAPKKKPTRRKAEPAKATAQETSSKAAKGTKKPAKPETKAAGKKPATAQAPATPAPPTKRSEPSSRARAKAEAPTPTAHPDDAKQVDLEDYLKEKHPEARTAESFAESPADIEPPEVRVWIDERAWDALTPEARAEFEEPVKGSGVDWEGRVGWITARVPPDEVLTALRGYALDHHLRLIEAETEPPRDTPTRPTTDVVVLSITVPERTPDAMQWARDHHLAWFEEAPAFWLPWGFEGGAPAGKIRVVATIPRAS